MVCIYYSMVYCHHRFMSSSFFTWLNSNEEDNREKIRSNIIRRSGEDGNSYVHTFSSRIISKMYHFDVFTVHICIYAYLYYYTNLHYHHYHHHIQLAYSTVNVSRHIFLAEKQSDATFTMPSNMITFTNYRNNHRRCPYVVIRSTSTSLSRYFSTQTDRN